MTREIHTAPSTWGDEMTKANSNFTELYAGVADSASRLSTLEGQNLDTRLDSLESPVIVQEAALFDVAKTACNTKSLILGGMEFKWSQANLAGGVLYIGKASGITRGTAGGGAAVRVYNGSTMTYGGSSSNPTLWAAMDSNTPINGSLVLTAAYQYIEYDLFTRGAANPSHWKLLAFWTGSDTLFMSGTYIGPKIT